MSADYHKSTQKRKWKFKKDQLLQNRTDPLQYARIRLYLFEEMAAFGTRLNIRQRVVSTAQVFLSRMLTKTQIGEINPYLLMATCVYVASRTEEQPIYLRTVCAEARHNWPRFMPVEPWQLAECEFYLLYELETCIVVYHPYIPLLKLSNKFHLSNTEIQACWALVNDTYATDIPLLFTPSEVAFTAIYMILVLKPGLVVNRTAETVKKRLENLSKFMGAYKSLDLRSVMECIQEMLSLYALKSKFRSPDAAEELRLML